MTSPTPNVVNRGAFLRPDQVSTNFYQGQSRAHYFNLAAFAPTPAGAGRFGNAGVGILQGPGTTPQAWAWPKSSGYGENARTLRVHIHQCAQPHELRSSRHPDRQPNLRRPQRAANRGKCRQSYRTGRAADRLLALVAMAWSQRPTRKESPILAREWLPFLAVWGNIPNPVPKVMGYMGLL